MTVFCGPNEWEDATGYKWCSKFGSRDIADGCRKAEITVGSILGGDVNAINLGSFVDLIYFGIRYMAQAQNPKLTRDRFYDERVVGGKVLTAALEATANAFAEAFDVGDEDEPAPDPPKPAPADPGDSPMSSSSPPAPASASGPITPSES